MDNDVLNRIVLGILSIFIIFLSFVLLLTFIRHKKRKLLEDRYNIERQFFDIIFFIIFGFFDFAQLGDLLYYSKVKHVMLTAYFSINIILSCLIIYEKYLSQMNPFYTFQQYILKNKLRIEGEVTVLGLTIMFITLNFSYAVDDNMDEMYLIPTNLSLCLFCVCFSLWIIYINFRIKTHLSFQLANVKKILFIINLQIFQNIVKTLFFIVLSGVNICFILYDMNSYSTLFLIITYFFIALSFMDKLILMLEIYKTDFYFYKLSDSTLGLFYTIFGFRKYKKPLLNEEFISYNGSGKDNIILFYQSKMKYMLESQNIETADVNLNISLSSIYLVLSLLYNKPKNNKESKEETSFTGYATDFKSSKKEKLLHKDANYDIKTSNSDKQLPTSIQMSTGKKNQEKTEISEFISKYQFFKNSTQNDFSDEKLNKLTYRNEVDGTSSSLVKMYENLTVKVDTYYTQNFLEIMTTYKIDINMLKNSLIAHFNPAGENWSSLIMKNCKDSLYRKLDKMILKTQDKLFNIEIVNSYSLFNDSVSTKHFLKKYFSYLKKNQYTLLPIILGLYKIQINNFHTLTIIISRNKLLEEVPKEYFNSWQLIKVSQDKSIQLMTSSKDRPSSLIKEEDLFKDNFKLNMSNFLNFEDSLLKDLKFLKKLRISDFRLFIIYYEIGKTANNSLDQSHRKKSTTSFRKSTEEIKAFRISAITKNEEIYQDIRTSTLRDNSLFDLRNELNLINFRENNGFEAHYNDNKVILFFVFDNIFENYSCFRTKNYYSDFFREISSRLEETNPFIYSSSKLDD
jgi:hypothetical protein